MEEKPIPQEPADEQGGGLAYEIHTWFREVILCLSIVTLVFAFAVRLVNTDGSSMKATLYNSDKLIVRSALLYDPKPGDVVVLRAEGYEDEPLVKRIIAVGGQTVDIDFDRGIVYVDGAALDEPYVYEPTYVRGNVTFPQTVREGYVFVLGDNRNNSTDSRFTKVGQVREEMILGKVEAVFWPLSHFGRVH